MKYILMVSVATTNGKFAKLIMHPSFNYTLSEIKKLKIKLPDFSSDLSYNFDIFKYPLEGNVLSPIEKISKFQLDPFKGKDLATNFLPLFGYDESIQKFSGLEGTGYLTSHAVVYHGEFDFIPITLLSFYFYTKSRTLSDSSDYIRYSDDHETDSKRDYIVDRENIITDNLSNNSIIFIDGPLIGGQMSSYTLKLNKILLDKDIIPIFLVKNSTSNLVTENIAELKNKFNSDMHWAYRYLKPGERTNLFIYSDSYVKNNAKIFCYIKSFETSPQRIEIDVNVFNKFKNKIEKIFDLIYYLILAQGDLKNPQLRTIAIAEKYARSSISLLNIIQIMKDLGITPTINQERFT